MRTQNNCPECGGELAEERFENQDVYFWRCEKCEDRDDAVGDTGPCAGYYQLKRIIKPWAVVGHRGELFQFDTRQEAAAFVKAENEQMESEEEEEEREGL
jgi:hypothetical protein